MTKNLCFENKYTGEILPFKTITNVKPDDGINKDPGEDLCRLEDFETIGQVCARFLKSGYDVTKEYAYINPPADGLFEDFPSDIYDDSFDDLIDTQIDLEDYIDSHSVSAVGDFSTRVANNSEKIATAIEKDEKGEGANVVSDDDA